MTPGSWQKDSDIEAEGTWRLQDEVAVKHWTQCQLEKMRTCLWMNPASRPKIPCGYSKDNPNRRTTGND
ncbi:Hypothetical predicted protein [Podarcis lilfordi]|uniref:Uncharacterized protein n=1 Tax=Podarcis lilfordi TaxID=74358 RepID=A0AA35KTQ2_9SAUR|nr:Hypothetical predicted protein [Podarcis lilfordi]